MVLIFWFVLTTLYENDGFTCVIVGTLGTLLYGIESGTSYVSLQCDEIIEIPRNRLNNENIAKQENT